MITLIEIWRLLFMTLAIGYIFSGIYSTHTDPLKKRKWLDWDNIKIGILAAAPGVILHEMAHKFVAIGYGLNAEFFASYFGLGLGVILKLVSSPFIVFVPGFVQVVGATPIQSAIIAFAGPLTNGLLWIASWYIITNYPNMSHKKLQIVFLNKRINGILFFFNLIPFPPFDGGHIFRGIMSALG